MSMYNIPVIGKHLLRMKMNKEGGEKESKTIRKHFKKNYATDVDMYTYGGCFDKHFNLNGKVKIGKYCSIGQNVRYLAGNHPLNHASTSPYFYNTEWAKRDVKDIERGSLEIGNDVWIGYGTIITSKCTKIGNGAVIGAGTIVTKDVPPYAVVVGNPGRVIKYRFDEDTIKLLNKSEWWNLRPDQTIEFYDYIENPVEFANKVLEYNKENS